VGLIKVNQKGKHNRSLKVTMQGLGFVAHPLYIHTRKGMWHASEKGVQRFHWKSSREEATWDTHKCMWEIILKQSRRK
jgi:hypothetical protein